MKRFSLLWIIEIGILIIAIAVWLTTGQAQQNETSIQESKVQKAAVATLPSSLDTLFPPKAEQPLYLFKMLGLGKRFSATSLFENDPEHAKTNFEEFKAQYVEVSKLVPEWEKEYPMDPIEELGASLNTGDHEKVMSAHEKVRKVCHECHVIDMPKAQQKYHWGEPYAIRVKDPLTTEEVDYSRLMKYLDANFAGISTYAEHGEGEGARRQLQDFNTRFQTMKETCTYCHHTERKYYVDENQQILVAKLKQALSGSSIDPKIVEALTQEIGRESCFKCHLVHIPAAYANV